MKEKNVPMRRCVGCMVSRPKRELSRYVITPEGTVPDPTGKAQGRGIYVCADNPECLKKAMKKGRID